MNPSQMVYDVAIHAFGDTSLKFALEFGRAMVWALVFVPVVVWAVRRLKR